MIIIFVKKSRNLQINNRFQVVKTKNDRQYFGLVVALKGLQYSNKDYPAPS